MTNLMGAAFLFALLAIASEGGRRNAFTWLSVLAFAADQFVKYGQVQL